MDCERHATTLQHGTQGETLGSESHRSRCAFAKINKNESRYHWPHCYSAILAGGGITRGNVYGTSDGHGMYPLVHPVRPEDLSATMFYLLGIAPGNEIHDRTNRPLMIAPGQVIHPIVV